MPKVSVTIITLNEADHIAAAIDSVAWADEVIVVDSGSADDTVAIARGKGATVSFRPWTGYVEQKNHAAALAAHDWIFSLDADERVPPALAAEMRALLASEPERRGYRVPRVTFHLGRWIRTTDFYPDYQLRLYDRRAARWRGRYVHESVHVDGPIAYLKQELEHYSVRDLQDHAQRINHYTTLAARQMHEAGRRARLLDLLVHPPAAFFRNYILKRGFMDGGVGLTISLMNAHGVFLKFAKLLELQDVPKPEAESPKPEATTFTPTGREWHPFQALVAVVRDAVHLSRMLSLHIDTARGWGGGQRQVFETVVGLRAAGARAILVAHPEGELLRRMSEGLDLVALAPRSDVDISAAWKLSRLLKSNPPAVVHAHDSHAVAMAATALAIAAPEPPPLFVASRRSEFRVDRSSFSRWKYSQVDVFIATSGTVRDRLVATGVARQKIAVISPGVDVDRVQRTAALNVHAEFYLPTQAPIVGNVASLVPHKGQQHLIEVAALVVRAVPDARFVIVGGGEMREPLEKQIRDHHLERHVFLAGFRSDVIELTRGFDVFASSALHEGASVAILDAMAAAKPVVATATGSVSEVVVDGETGFIVPPRDDRALADRIVTMLRDEGLRRAMGEAGLARARGRFGLDRMVGGTMRVYERVIPRD